MVANLTIGKKKYALAEAAMRDLKRSAELLRRSLLGLARRDAEAFDAVLRARKLPEGSEAERTARERALALADLAAAKVPLETAAACLEVLRLAAIAARSGNTNAVTDAGVAGWLARAGAEGAILNVQINLKSLSGGADKKAVEMELRRVREAIEPAARECLDAVNAALNA
jgi:glutamate formiminotransferase/formiminotetrahydrofolate cyclodeaminase